MSIPDADLAFDQTIPDCKHLCSMDCGNEFEFVVTTVSDSTTQFLCVPDFVNTAMLMVMSMTDNENPLVQEAMAAYKAETVQPKGTRGRKRSLRDDSDATDGSEFLDEFEPDTTEED